MTRDQLKKLLANRKNDEFVDTEIINRRPWIFTSDDEHASWSGAVAAALQLDKDRIHIVGSAATGYSLSPYKAGRPFKKVGSGVLASDIDLAITSAELFEDAWNTIIAFDRRL